MKKLIRKLILCIALTFVFSVFGTLNIYCPNQMLFAYLFLMSFVIGWQFDNLYNYLFKE